MSVFGAWSLRFDEAPVQHFLIPRVLARMHGLGEVESYQFDLLRGMYVIGIRVTFPSSFAADAGRRARRLLSPISSTLRALSEKMPAMRQNGGEEFG